MRDVTFNAFAGIRNDVKRERLGATASESGARAYLESATNLDVDNSGEIALRGGAVQISATATHSLWSDGRELYFVRGGQLQTVRGDVLGTVSGQLAYCTDGDTVFCTDGVRSYVVRDGALRQWGVTEPSAVSASIVAGGMEPGHYIATATYVNADGVESGCADFIAFDIAAGGAVTVSVPDSDDPEVIGKRIYLTHPDGETLYAVAALTTLTSSTFLTKPTYGATLRTEGSISAPAGSGTFFFAGRTLIVAGNAIWYSAPGEPERFDGRYGYLMCESDVRFALPVDDGVYVATDTGVQFFAGRDPSQMTVVEVSRSKAVKHSAVISGTGPSASVLWVAEDGIYRGSPGGQTVSITSTNYIPPEAASATSCFSHRAGLAQFRSILRSN